MKKTLAKSDGPTQTNADRLRRYRSKRDPAQTTEPFAPEQASSEARTLVARFVVHLHAARRTHYDLRLQIGGALASFAVPKGPSLNPEERRLAVKTEDHPLEYLEFEDVIPEGNYGAGAMIAWDVGRVQYLEGSAEEGVARGKIDFLLFGFKLKGRFALVKTSDRGSRSQGRRVAGDENESGGGQWLLLKKQDAFASGTRDLLAEAPRSVFSGLTVEQLARRTEREALLIASASAADATKGELDARKLMPMLCAISDVPLSSSDRIYELKLDGVRIVADKRGSAVTLRYRNGRNASASYPEIVRAIALLPVERLVLDGEILAFDAGRPSFQRLARRIHASKPQDVVRLQAEIPVVYIAFDLLALGPFTLFDVPLIQRKAILSEVIQGAGFLRTLDHLEGEGAPLMDFVQKERLEGIVAKRKHSKYRPGPKRTDDWIKVKCERDDEFVVVGWVPSKGAQQGLGALCVGSYQGGACRLRGRVGSGLTRRDREFFEQQLRGHEVEAYPCVGERPDDLKTAHFVRPELVVTVRFQGWTEEGRLRAPVFLCHRPDRNPKECVAAPIDELTEAAEPSTLEGAGTVADDRTPKRVQVSNRDKIFWPAEGYTKGDLCDYYEKMAEFMLPFLRDRPVVLVRYPDGIHGKNFYQWNVPVGTPDWIQTLEVVDEESGKKKTLFLVDNADALIHIANLGCIPLHVLAAKADTLDQCDFLTLDLDIGEQPFKSAVTLALALRDLLEELGLSGYPKTSGQKGLHVLVPLGPGVSFDSAKLLVELIGRLLVSQHPELATMQRRISKRGPRVYVDTGQTGRSRTIVAPYSVRAYPGATVSTPLAWEEVHAALDPSRFTLATVPGRVALKGEFMAPLLQERPDVARAVALLERKLH